MSKIEVDAVEPQSGTSLTIGASGDTITIPAGATINNQGTATNFGATGAASWTTTVKTTTFTATAGEGYFCNTTAGAFTVNLPAGTAGAVVAVKDYAGTFGSNNLTISPNGSEKIGGVANDATVSTAGIAATLVFIDSTRGWLVTDDGLQTSVPQIYSAEYLVVAGGGTGAGGGGGGGGAGGYLTNYGGSAITLTRAETYTVTVGAGGASVTGNPKVIGNSGNNSVLSGTGISTVTAIGGGGAGTVTVGNYDGLDGGSGGGGGSTGTGPGGSGTVGQGNDGGAGVSSVGGGGGGAGESGNTDGAGDGGDGSSNSITGSAVVYAGGGGGSNGGGGSLGSGGDGGGTAGVANPSSSASSPANTGGGTGATNDQPTGAAGSGVVILRVATADYSGTTSGSPTVTTDGSDTIIKFTSSGSYTA
jgi:hypothetical protein